MFILLAGVWSVSAEAGVAHIWSDDSQSIQEDEGEREDEFAFATAMDNETGPSITASKVGCEWTGGTRPGAVPMDRNAYSEEGSLGLEGSVSMHTLQPGSTCMAHDSLLLAGSSRSTEELDQRRTVSCSGSQRRPMRSFTEGLSPSARIDLSRRQSTGVLDLPGAGTPTLGGSSSSGGGGQVMSPAWLTIGLSPMSPGFGVAAVRGQRRARRVSGVGLGLELGRGESSGRAQMVSEGDAQQSLPNGSQGRAGTSRGWRSLAWLVRATRRANQESS